MASAHGAGEPWAVGRLDPTIPGHRPDASRGAADVPAVVFVDHSEVLVSPLAHAEPHRAARS